MISCCPFSVQGSTRASDFGISSFKAELSVFPLHAGFWLELVSCLSSFEVKSFWIWNRCFLSKDVLPPTDEQSARVDVTATDNVKNQRQRIPVFNVKKPSWDRKGVIIALNEKLQRASAKGNLRMRQALLIRDDSFASKQGNRDRIVSAHPHRADTTTHRKMTESLLHPTSDVGETSIDSFI